MDIYRTLTKLREGYVFTGVCDSVHRGGACMVARGCVVAGGHVWLLGGVCGCWGCVIAGGVWLHGGMHGCWGGAWWGACMVWGGMCGCWGACVVAGGAMHGCTGGHTWLLGGVWLGVCMAAGGVCGCWGACMVARGVHGCRGACIGYDKIRSMSGRYASYWNAFLFP